MRFPGGSRVRGPACNPTLPGPIIRAEELSSYLTPQPAAMLATTGDYAPRNGLHSPTGASRAQAEFRDTDEIANNTHIYVERATNSFGTCAISAKLDEVNPVISLYFRNL
ncbi:hypothetical protein [Sphingobium sp. CR28]|uniref:hypothetical protein n=1 Tax=Sphingobium sp. CR28 TaxID=3400272 RepID=UPI003FF02420